MNCATPMMKMTMRTDTTNFGDVFEPVAMRIGVETHLPLGGLLTPAGPLRRCQLLELPRGRDRHGARMGDGWMLRLRVRGDALRDDGIRDGDYLVLDARNGRLRDGQTVLAEEAGCTVVRRVRGVGSSLRLEALETTGASLPLLRGGCSGRDRIHGAVVGILRKELRQQPEPSGPDTAQRTTERAGAEIPPLEPVNRLCVLQRSLRTVTSTYRATRHPRLRRALRDEAALLGREMARERERLGEGIGEVVLLN